MLPPDPLHPLWHTPLGVHRFAQAEAVNPVLVRVFQTLRITEAGGPSAQPAPPFYASRDDLLQRIQLPEWEQLIRFLVDRVRETVVLANQGAWPEAKPGLQLALRGIWFQIANQGSHHDVHTHGNCSWSGVYCLQVDPPEQRRAHPVLGASNGVTRFYGPHFNRLGGAGRLPWQGLGFESAPQGAGAAGPPHRLGAGLPWAPQRPPGSARAAVVPGRGLGPLVRHGGNAQPQQCISNGGFCLASFVGSGLGGFFQRGSGADGLVRCRWFVWA